MNFNFPGFGPQGMSQMPCQGCSSMGDMSGMNSMALGMQQQFMMMMMSMLSSLFQGGFGSETQNSMGGLPTTPSFGASAPSGDGGLNNFLGGSAGAKASKSRTSHSRKPKVDRGSKTSPSKEIGTASDGKAAPWGKKLAEYAKSHGTGSGGYCFRYVGQALRKFGVQTSGASAYMAGPQLAKSNKFREVKMNPSQLKKLPPGAVVVWDRGNGHEHGHISIALGGGKEVSDVPRDQITNYGTSARVFLPK